MCGRHLHIVNIINNRATSVSLIWYFYDQLWKDFKHYYGDSIVEFVKVNAGWKIYTIQSNKRKGEQHNWIAKNASKNFKSVVTDLFNSLQEQNEADSSGILSKIILSTNDSIVEVELEALHHETISPGLKGGTQNQDFVIPVILHITKLNQLIDFNYRKERNHRKEHLLSSWWFQ